MARIELAAEVFNDIERFFDHIAQFDVGSAPECMEPLLQSLQVLAISPLIGRPVPGGKRELVIGGSSRGCVALYRYVGAIDTVFILALRGQREAGFDRER